MERKTEDWIQSFLEWTDNSEPPKLYREWVAVSTLAAVLKRKVYLQWGSLEFYPNLYIVLVGPAGRCRKGTAMGTGARLLRELGIALAAESTTRESLIEQLHSATETDFSEDNESIIHASLTVYSQELAVFFSQGDARLLMDMTDWYDCRDVWKYKTKGSGTNNIINVWVNLIGATTPALIQNMFPRDAIGGGLASRIIFVYEENKDHKVPFPFLTAKEISLREDILLDLENLKTLQGAVTPTEEFFKAWEKWYLVHEDEVPFVNDSNFTGYVERRPAHVMKLNIIMAASMNSVGKDGNLLLTTDVLARSIDLIRRTEVKMPNTFAGYGSARNVEVMSRIRYTIRTRKQITQQELLASFSSDFDSIQDLTNILDLLAAMGEIRRKQKADGHTYIYYLGGSNNDE